MKKTFPILFWLFALCVANAQPINTNLSNGLLFDGEPFIALNPTNPQNLVAAWMGLNGRELLAGTSSSVDA